MAYFFEGNLCGYLCLDCWEPLGDVTVRLYRVDQRSNTAALAVADPKETFAILDEEAVAEKEARLLAESPTDADGNFSFNLGEDYRGEAFEVDVRCTGVARGRPDERSAKPRQFTITTLQPRFRQTERGYLALWRYCLPYRYWCAFLALFDVWTICGHVTLCDGGKPVAGVKVLAFDADWVADDPLGSDLTDGNGAFRITYSSVDFKQGTWIDVELVGGPDLYFRVEDSSGSVLLAEPRLRGRDPDRENAGNCHCVSLCVEQALVADLTGPTGCTVEEPNTATGTLTIAVMGTASGAGFGSYTLEVEQSGSPVAGVSVLYPGGGPTGTAPVVAGELGKINTTSLMDGPYTVKLTVFPSGPGMPVSDLQPFTLVKVLVYMTRVGAIAVDPNPIVETAELRTSGALRSVGGSLRIEGVAYVYGCADRTIKRYDIRKRQVLMPGTEEAQPATDAPLPAGWGGNLPPLPLEYAVPDQYQPWTRVGPAPRDLVNTWKTFTVGSTTYYGLNAQAWGSSESGRFSLLLVVEDTASPTPHIYYDIQHIWLDNKEIYETVRIVKLQRSIGGVWTDIPPCQDLLVSFGKVRIVGLAWDPVIDEAWPLTAPNDNFGHYSLQFWKQFGAGHVLLGNTSTRVPPLPAAAPVVVPTDAQADELAQWDLGLLDGGVAPMPPVPAPDPTIYRGDSCSYNVQLYATDSTVVSGGSTHHHSHTVPVKVVNDL